jgi:putative tricarboxylic transport membrane protein
MNTRNRTNYQIIPVLFWIGLGFFVMILSHNLGLGGLRNPGPGLMPFLLGFFLCMVSFYVLILSLRRKEETDSAAQTEQGGQVRLGKLCLVLASLFVYALLLEPLGFLVTTFLVLVILFRTLNSRWRPVLVASVLTALTAYFLFSYLGVQFPKGILKGL